MCCLVNPYREWWSREVCWFGRFGRCVADHHVEELLRLDVDDQPCSSPCPATNVRLWSGGRDGIRRHWRWRFVAGSCWRARTATAPTPQSPPIRVVARRRCRNGVIASPRTVSTGLLTRRGRARPARSATKLSKRSLLRRWKQRPTTRHIGRPATLPKSDVLGTELPTEIT